MSYSTQKCHPKGGFACHALQVAVKAKFDVYRHPQDIDRVLDDKGVTPNFSWPSIFLASSRERGEREMTKAGLGFFESKLNLPSSAPGHDVTKLAVGGISHVHCLLSPIAV
ncbi:hypothetical protein E2C01_043042 [Portunus trituberculatus]|uniref:Uncharacterized protein n=1 Tax=Portunus trituberculatus TaxID=210409 RepID=A0A5B7FV87_PORTR|nr:hypothetical protein [Portunus trituberculatus]